MFKLLSALALFAVVGLAQAQSGQVAALRADALPTAERDSFSAGAQPAAPGLREGSGSSREACGARGEPACAKTTQRESSEAAATGSMTSGPALMWAALGVIAFVALRRRPRP